MTKSKQSRPGRKFGYLIAASIIVTGSLYGCSSSDSEGDKNTQFSGWDDAHILLAKRMNDQIKDRIFEPDSYEHLQTNRQVVGETVTIVTTFNVNNHDGETEMHEVSAMAPTSGGDDDLKIVAWRRLDTPPER